MLDQRKIAVLAWLLGALRESEVAWALTGSAAHSLYGLALEVRDIDVITDRAGAFAIEARLAQHVVRAVGWREAGDIRSWFGALAIDGVEVELMGDVELRAQGGSWLAPIEVGPRRRFVPAHGLVLPVMALDHEIEFYERLGRRARARELRALLRAGAT